MDRLCKLLNLPLSFIIGPYIFQYTFVCRSRHPRSTYIRLNDLSHHDLQNIYFIFFDLYNCTTHYHLFFPNPSLLRGKPKKTNGATKEWMQLMSASPRGDRFRNDARRRAQLLWLRQQRLGLTWYNPLAKPLRSSKSWKNIPLFFVCFSPVKA